MHSRTIAAARVIAWFVARRIGLRCGSWLRLAELPVTRWTTAPKSLFLALRVPLINLLSLGLIEVMSRGLRVNGYERANEITTALLLTAAAKAAIEAVGILMLPKPLSWTLLPLVAVLLIGLGTAAWFGRELFRRDSWKQMQLTRLETAAAVALVAGIVALNLPLFMR